MARLFPVPNMRGSVGKPRACIYRPMAGECRYILLVARTYNRSLHDNWNIYRICLYPQKNKCGILGICVSSTLPYHKPALIVVWIWRHQSNNLVSLECHMGSILHFVGERQDTNTERSKDNKPDRLDIGSHRSGDAICCGSAHIQSGIFSMTIMV